MNENKRIQFFPISTSHNLDWPDVTTETPCVLFDLDKTLRSNYLIYLTTLFLFKCAAGETMKLEGWTSRKTKEKGKGLLLSAGGQLKRDAPDFKTEMHRVFAQKMAGRRIGELIGVYTDMVQKACGKGKLWYPKVPEFIRSLTQKGIHVVFISGSHGLQTQQAVKKTWGEAEQAKIHVIASDYPIDGDAYTGSMCPGMLCATREQKKSALDNMPGGQLVIGAAGNDVTDIDMLLAVNGDDGHGVRLAIGKKQRFHGGLREQRPTPKNITSFTTNLGESHYLSMGRKVYGTLLEQGVFLRTARSRC